MEEQKLFVEMTIRSGNNYITARCPNEDDEMSITIKNKHKINYMLTLQEAEDFADFLIEHVKQSRLLNREARANSSNDNIGLNAARVITCAWNPEYDKVDCEYYEYQQMHDDADELCNLGIGIEHCAHCYNNKALHE